MARSKLMIIAVSIILCLTACRSGKEARKHVIFQGEVNRPGEYLINNNIPYILVLLEARGYTPNADATQVILERNGKSVILDLSIPADKMAPHLAEKFILHPYDRITVPSKVKKRKN